MSELAWPIAFCVMTLSVCATVFYASWSNTMLRRLSIEADREQNKSRNLYVDAYQGVESRLTKLEERLNEAPPQNVEKDIADLRNRFDKIAIAIGLGSVAYKAKV